MTKSERQKKAEENGLIVFFLAMMIWMMAGCCTTPQVEGDMTRNDCVLEQTGWAFFDQLPKILRAVK